MLRKSLAEELAPKDKITCYFLLNYAQHKRYPYTVTRHVCALAIFFWIMRLAWRKGESAGWGSVTCYFLLNYACPVLTRSAGPEGVESHGPACYFLLNYAQVFWDPDEWCSELPDLAIFFWIMHRPAALRPQPLPATHILLFSFELCWWSHLALWEFQASANLLFSFELCKDHVKSR